MPCPPPKIAISLGGSGSSSQIKKRTRPTYNKRHRAGANDGYDDSESDNDQSDEGRSSNKRNGRAETILTYGDDDFTSASSRSRKDSCRDRDRGRDGGRERDDRGEGRRDKDSHRNRSRGRERRDSRDRRRRSHSREIDGRKPTDPEEEKPVQWGLTINPKSTSTTSNSRSSPLKRSATPESKPKSLNEEALESLLGGPSQPKKRKFNLDSEDPNREPQAEDYEAVPIDDFGAALLRNFGWNGEMKGKVKEIKRHADLAGLGARNTTQGEETGTWDPKAGMHKKDTRPVRLNDYRKEEEKKRQRREEQRGHNSYRRELEREREQERERGWER